MVTCYKIFLKTTAIATAIMGLLVLVICSLTAVGIYTSESTGNNATEDEEDAIENTPIVAVWDHGVSRLTTVGEEYRKALIAVFVITGLAGIAQIVVSYRYIIAPFKDLKVKERIWVTGLSVVFILIIVCFIIVYAYSQEESGAGYSNALKARFQKHLEAMKNKPLWGDKTELINKYFLILGINEGILMLILILGCVGCVTDKTKYDSLE